tara:strand:- start:19435 stop:19854 length:420 start_codon:yes stop_codon:yes gene_type:complete
LAWLHAVPDYGEKDRPRLSRRAEFKAFKVDFDEPPEPDAAQYLIHWFFESGMVMATGAGAAPLTWQELEAYGRSAGLELTGWERSTLMEMSRTYCEARDRFRKPASPPPYFPLDGNLAKQRMKRAERQAQREARLKTYP